MSAAEDLQLDNFVKAEFGDGALTQLNNQSRGGDNNSKGNQHEQRFAVYKLAKAHGEKPDDEIEISSQDRAFVDDLVVMNKSDNSKKSYQLKDSKSVYWSNKKGIKPYFKRQHSIDTKHLGIKDSETVLVLAIENVYMNRKRDIPRDIKPHTRCLHFPNPDSVNELLITSNDFKTAMGYLCPWPDETDKLEVVTQQLLGTWATHNKTVRNVGELIEKAKVGADPNFFCSPHSTVQLDESVAKILDEIDNLRYEVRGDYLNYSYGGLSGFVEFKLGTQEFHGMCEKIRSQAPKNAKDLLLILIGNGEGA